MPEPPDARVGYVDNDPIVLAYVQADMHAPDALCAGPAVHRTLAPSRPVALTVIAMLPFVEDAHGIRRSSPRVRRPGAARARGRTGRAPVRRAPA